MTQRSTFSRLIEMSWLVLRPKYFNMKKAGTLPARLQIIIIMTPIETVKFGFYSNSVAE